MPNSLLIVEEALRDLKAHWFEYINTITTAAKAEDWDVEVACHQDVIPEIQKTLSVFPIFQYARYLDNAKKRLPGERYYSFILHSFRCLKVLFPFLNQRPRYHHIFVPTVLVHHLLAWWFIMTFHPQKPEHLTLFFVTNPGVWSDAQQASFLPKSARLQGFLLKWFHTLVQRQKVTLAVETQVARQEFEQLTGLPFTQLPHPVPEIETQLQPLQIVDRQPTFACYGFARYEKGSDILKTALKTWLDHHSESTVQFRIQWTESFQLPDGNTCEPDDLWQYRQVKVIDRPLLSADYQALLQTTDGMILPYRNSSYYARVSRIAIEAVCLGIPVIYTRGGWLEEVVQEFGAGIGIDDENVDSLINAIEQMLAQYDQYRQQALMQQTQARQYFSGQKFCQMLLQPSAK